MTHDAHIEQLRRTARERAQAREAFRLAILSANRDGMSYREIAKHAGISHSRVQQIVNEAKRG